MRDSAKRTGAGADPLVPGSILAAIDLHPIALEHPRLADAVAREDDVATDGRCDSVAVVPVLGNLCHKICAEALGPTGAGPSGDHPVAAKPGLRPVRSVKREPVPPVVDDVQSEGRHPRLRAAPKRAVSDVESLAITIRVAAAAVVRGKVFVWIYVDAHLASA